jgi:hypothetical protein
MWPLTPQGGVLYTGLGREVLLRILSPEHVFKRQVSPILFLSCSRIFAIHLNPVQYFINIFVQYIGNIFVQYIGKILDYPVCLF